MNEDVKIVEFLQQNYQQPLPNKRYWTSYKNQEDIWEDGWADMTKEFANRTQCQFEINFGKLEDSTPNLVVNLYTVVDLDWMQVFWGDVETLEDLKFILNCIGIPYKN